MAMLRAGMLFGRLQHSTGGRLPRLRPAGALASGRRAALRWSRPDTDDDSAPGTSRFGSGRTGWPFHGCTASAPVMDSAGAFVS
mgnify:CR=1 FL=1